MKNIKTLEVISELPGLEVGDTLTRKDSDSDFVLNVETVTEAYTAKRFISLSPSLINKDEFKAIEWFEPVVTNKQKIAVLEAKIKELNSKLECASSAEVDLAVLRGKMVTKRREFNDKVTKITNRIEKEILTQGQMDYANEGLTVLANLIEYTDKLLA